MLNAVTSSSSSITTCSRVGCEWPYKLPANQRRCCYFQECSVTQPPTTKPTNTATTKKTTTTTTPEPKWKIPVIVILCIVGAIAIVLAVWALIRNSKKNERRRQAEAVVMRNQNVAATPDIVNGTNPRISVPPKEEEFEP